MSSESEEKRVQFRAPKRLVDRADTLAAVFETNRTDTLISAFREYPRDTAHSDEVKQGVAEVYYDNAITFEELKSLVGYEEAANLRLLRQQLSEAFVDDVAEELADIQMVRIVADTSALINLGTVTDATINLLDLLLESRELLLPEQVLGELAETASYDDTSGEHRCSVKYWIASRRLQLLVR